MAMKVKKIDIWVGDIRDEAGGLASALAPLVAAGIDFSFVIGTRRPDKPGTGTAYLGGLRGARQAKAASLAGFVKSEDAHGLRVVARDQPRLLHRVTSELAAAGINLRSVSASVIKSRCVMIFAFDDVEHRDKAAELLGK
jgi:hypothetical protein